ncbi:MAG: extracellular solute-binding protein [Alphaproteobacteria bacterium]|nr:extracellular solute-binding protein [Alphaproteobacteria bacterium]
MRKGWIAGLTVVAAFAATEVRAQGTLNIYNWNDYVSQEALDRFQKETGIKVVYDTYDSNETLDAKLRAGRSGYDLVVPTASPFLAQQIPAHLYQPFDRAKLPNFKNIDPVVLKQLERADPGNRYGIPHLASTTGIGYNIERISRIMADAPVYSLRMIFDPEIIKRFQSCGVVILDSPTDVFPAALAYLNLDPDSKSPENLKKATDLVMKIRPYVRKWHSSEYINDLANGDACLVFGYSGDIKQAAARAVEAKKREVRIEYAIPQEGAQLANDVWAIPADARNVDAAHRFVDFMLRPEIAALNSDAVGYPNAVPASRRLVRPEVRDDPTVFVPDEIRARLYTITPAKLDYERLRTRAWTRVTAGR